MYCGNCGTQVGDTAKFCPKCGKRIPRPDVPDTECENQAAHDEPALGSDPVRQDPLDNKEPAWQEHGSSNGSGFQEGGNPYDSGWQAEPSPDESVKKSTLVKRSITLGVVLAAVILVVAAVVLHASALTNLAMKTFASPASYYQYVEAKALGNTVSTAASLYDVVLRDNLQTDNRSVSLDATLTLEDSGKTLLTAYTGEDLSWFSSLGLSIDANSKGDLSSSAASLSLGSDQLISCNVITDLDSKALYLQVPELSQDYAEISLEDYLEDAYYYYDSDSMDEVFDTLTTLYERCPDKATVEKILNRYVKTVLSCLDDVEKGTDTLSAQGVSQKYTTLEVTIDAEVLQEVLKNVLEEMLEDEDLEEVILNFAELGEAEGMDPDDVYEEFTDALEDLLDELDELDDYDMDDIVMTVWVDGSGEIRGRKLEYEDVDLYYAMPKDGKDFGLELSYSDGYEDAALTGSGTISGGKLSGSFALTESATPLGFLKVEQWDTDKLQDGYLSGTFTLQPANILNVSLSGFYLTITADTAKDSADYEISVSTSSAKLGTLALSTKTGSATGRVKAPSDTVSLERWANSVDLTGFLSSLRDTDLPSDLVDELIEEFIY
jgi:hypothetical protein